MRYQSFIKASANLLLVMISLSLSLMMMELIYRPIEPARQRIYFNTLRGNFFQYDPLLGWANTPRMEGIFERKNFTTYVKINTDGMRYNHDIGEKKTFRVAVLGDSFAWGFGVEANQRFTEIIEKDRGIEMLNFAVPGYGPVQYYLQLDRVLSYNPDLVVIVFCLHNDFKNNLTNIEYGYYHSYAAIEDGKMSIKGLPVPYNPRLGAIIRPYITQMALGRLVYRQLIKYFPFHFNHKAKNMPPKEGMTNFRRTMFFDKPNSPQVKKATAINTAVLAAIKDKLAARQIPLLIFAPPTIDNPKANNIMLQILAEETQGLQIPLVTTYEEFGRQYFIKHNIHWNVKGHKKVAEILLPFIESAQANEGK